MTTTQGLGLNQPGLKHDPEWFKTAVFYEVLVRDFGDSNGSGAGDFQGVINRLDYLQWLGVDCLWLPPFYASPLRDGGYDIADYTQVLPEFGTLPQFQQLITEAHARGIRIITDFVMNHTSDQHPWFQASRSEPDGAYDIPDYTQLQPHFGTLPEFQQLITEAHARGIRIITDFVMNHTSDQHPWFQASRSEPDGAYGDFYVWSETDDKYTDARIIFIDTETSNWTFDPIRREFFWHRFFSHQPDLNFENPAVHEAMFEVVRFWMDMGIDGFRLDAVPYLYEEEGHNGENHPKTHAFLAKLRTMVDEEYPGRILLAEANQPPADVVDYFGTQDEPECQMCFHFPVMPMLYYALRDQRAQPIIDVLAQTPDIPPGTQWGTFLRNHDELTLEMVTPEQRAAMYGWYAPDPRMRANVGIRRRLSPLLDNSRPEIELIHALVLSLPGSPCLYYGDEIGMGDNIWLNDRDAVRTPMQWTPDRNAGFSDADPGKLYLPVISSLVYNYTGVNVEAQMATGHSLLHWLRGMLGVRRLHPAFGLGDFAIVPTDNESILAYTRSMPGNRDHSGETLLCVNNLSDKPQAATVQLPEALGENELFDLFGGANFPWIAADGRVTFTMGSRDFFWLRVGAEVRGEAQRRG